MLYVIKLAFLILKEMTDYLIEGDEIAIFKDVSLNYSTFMSQEVSNGWTKSIKTKTKIKPTLKENINKPSTYYWNQDRIFNITEEVKSTIFVHQNK